MKKIILIVVGSLFVLLTLVGFFGPRFVIYHHSKQVTAQLRPAAEYFTEFDLTLPDAESVQEVTFHGMTVTLPGCFKERESFLGDACIYEEPKEEGNTGGSTVIISFSDVSEMNQYIDEMMTERADGPLKKYVTKQLWKEFKDSENGIPSNYYALSKTCYLLTEEDYSFWNWKKGFAYVICGLLKNELAYPADYTYIYETEDICGYIYVVEMTDQAQSDSSSFHYKVIAGMYSKDDFSTEHVLIIRSDSLETAYAIINSAEIE